MQRSAIALMILTCAVLAHTAQGAEDRLVAGFARPPHEAKPWVYWWWLDSNASKAGITKDLEEMKRQGIGGALVFDAGKGKTSPVGAKFMSPAWRELFKHAAREADRLGLELSFNICSGWNCGGRWVTPAHALKRIVWSETRVGGPASFAAALPKPRATGGYYKDIAVLAARVTASGPDGRSAMEKASVKLTAGSTYQQYSTARALDRNPATRWISHGDKPGMGPTKAKPESLRFDFPKPFAAAGLFIVPYEHCGPRACQLQISADGKTFKTLRRFTAAPDKPQTIAFDEVRAKAFRLVISSSYPFRGRENWNVQIAEIQLLAKGEKPRKLKPPAAGPPLDSRSIVDLTGKLDASGRLVWDAPAGRWLILRFGQTLTGKRTKCVSRGSGGYEIDILSTEALDMHYAQTAGQVVADIGPLAGKTLKYLHDDSWESGEPNWTPRMRQQFRRRRGYDLLPYLPVLAGKTVDSAEVSKRFARDYRRTLADMVADNHYGHFRDLARRSGMGIHPESGGPFFVSMMDGLMNLGRSDIPMGEFWIRRSEPSGPIWYVNQYGVCDTVKQAATAAHVYGRKLCQAEAFTNMGRNWEEDPYMMKAIGDRALCAGLTRIMLCFYVHQPYLDIKPGYEWPGAGTHFDRNITWWNQIHAFTGYIARSQFLLQQGLFVADVCYYVGSDVPCYVPAKTRMKPPLPPGHDCDAVNVEVLMTRLSARDGRIVLPDGMSYRLLVLPQRDRMTPEALGKIATLVEAGATVVGPRPVRSPSLADYPACDEKVKSLAERLWGDIDGQKVKQHKVGKGRVIWGMTLQEILRADGIKPDFQFVSTQKGAQIDYIHRRTRDAEIYFVSNQLSRPEKAQCTFRVARRQPELWDVVTGRMRNAVAFKQTNDGRTTVPLELPPRGSVFVVFRKAIPASRNGSAAANCPTLAPVMAFKGPWTVTFDPKWGGPEKVVFENLVDWTKRPEEGIRYYSGTATYHKTFDLPGALGRGRKRIHLDLGRLKNVAAVRLNGKDLGVVWTAPWRVEITAAVKPTGNRLEIDVVNLWPNRLIGDAKLPAAKRLTKTNVTKFSRGKHKPLESGLLGPVTLRAAK